MTSFALTSPVSVSTTTPPPVGPPATSSPVVPPTGGTPPPADASPVAPRPPLTGISSTLVVDLTEASRLVNRAVELIGKVPVDDVGSEATKGLRIQIFKTSEAAQKRLEKQVTGNPDSVVSDLKKADAYLEDANWQLAKKPSPDGRFNGVDIPGAVRDVSEGARILNELLAAAGGTPNIPATPPPGPGGEEPPAGPPPVPGGGNVPPPGPGGEEPPAGPPPGPGGEEPPAGPPPAVPGGDGDYPGEDEFPTDDKIANSGGSSGDS